MRTRLWGYLILEQIQMYLSVVHLWTLSLAFGKHPRPDLASLLNSSTRLSPPLGHQYWNVRPLRLAIRDRSIHSLLSPQTNHLDSTPH